VSSGEDSNVVRMWAIYRPHQTGFRFCALGIRPALSAGLPGRESAANQYHAEDQASRASQSERAGRLLLKP
jgi:hypothetical protein